MVTSILTTGIKCHVLRRENTQPNNISHSPILAPEAVVLEAQAIALDSSAERSYSPPSNGASQESPSEEGSPLGSDVGSLDGSEEGSEEGSLLGSVLGSLEGSVVEAEVVYDAPLL